MTQPQTMNVAQGEILARATEMESAMPDPPSQIPAAPCGLQAAIRVAKQLDLSAGNMREYLTAGATERSNLAQSMRNAAKAYGEVDEEAAQTMNDGGGAIHSQGIDGESDTGGLADTQGIGGATAGYMDCKTVAALLEQPDQAASISAFADAWNNYNLTIQENLQRFRAFQEWEGDAAAAVQASMDQQKQWLLGMAKLSAGLGKQAAYILQLQKYARANHPSLAYIEGVEQLYNNEATMQEAMTKYAAAQQKSETVQDEYNTKTMIEPVNPPKPPAAVKVNAPADPATQGLIPNSVLSAVTSGGSGTPTMPQISPPMGGSGGNSGLPQGAGATLTGAREEASKLASELGAGMKPMSVGGGGGAGATAPLQPATDAESVRPAATGDQAATGRGTAPAGSASGGGGMGMPMGGQGQGGGSKAKSSQQDDEALYTEDRAWTEAVIGNRRRQDSKETK